MAKKKQSKRRRTFKVGADHNGIPYIRFRGKYLNRELGLNGGDRLEITRDNDLIILRKFSDEEVAQYEENKRANAQKALLKKLFPLNQKKQATPVMMVAENRSNGYSVENEVNHDKIVEEYRKIVAEM